MKSIAPVGPENDDYLRRAGASEDLLVAAWGNNARQDRIREVLAIPGFERLHCITTTKLGQPHHPVYLRSCPFACSVVAGCLRRDRPTSSTLCLPQKMTDQRGCGITVGQVDLATRWLHGACSTRVCDGAIRAIGVGGHR